jgi:murein DD-endopeptidase MepM/ murein hydrolase activator NlpD
MSLTWPWRAVWRLVALPIAVLGLAALPAGGTRHPGTAPLQVAGFERALGVDRLRDIAGSDFTVEGLEGEAMPSGAVAMIVETPGKRLNPSKVSPSKDRAAVTAYLAAASRSQTRLLFAPTLAWPLRGPITGPYGERRGNGRHPGIDISVHPGTPVHAAAPGNVVAAGTIAGYEGYGIIVVIDHGDGMVTIYAHLARTGTSIGSVVQTGDVIGVSGCSGSCTGPHLHFEVRVDGRARNPMDYLPS